ncbi:MAG: ATP-dependent helicase, partial [Desulfovibrionaceae bacterium]|nr:ATP-dependent helicase [Desulfovibrionaceae bacterium]
DAQSIYAFRGADITNILAFPKQFQDTTIIKLEENYRSVQPILDITNAILDNAPHAYQKRLISTREGGIKPVLIRTRTDMSQAEYVVSTVIELLKKYPPSEIAILFRAGYQSYSIELQLNKIGIAFQKYGGSTYTEASHIKDVVAFLRLIVNMQDYPAFQRVASLCKGIGEKTAYKLYTAYTEQDSASLIKYYKKYPDIADLLDTIQSIRESVELTPLQILERIFHIYQPLMEYIYPDDWVRRIHGLEQLEQMASSYTDLLLFLSDISLQEVKDDDKNTDDAVILSTVHSAKGLEWSAVLIIDLVEDRFPSKQSLINSDDYEEERRLLYVACTRAKEELYLFVPSQIYYKERQATIPVTMSPFIRELPSSLYTERKEGFAGIYTYSTDDEEE